MTHTQRINHAEEYTRKVMLEGLKKKNLLWECGYVPDLSISHTNHKSKTEYNGLNVVNLTFAQMENNYKIPQWLTYRQALDVMGLEKKGGKYSPVTYKDSGKRYDGERVLKENAQSVPIEYWKPIYWKMVNEKRKYIKVAEYKELKENGEDVGTKIVFDKCYWVYNIEETNLPQPKIKKKKGRPKSKVKILEDMIARYKQSKNAPTMIQRPLAKGESPHYSPLKHEIVVPTINCYKNKYRYYKTFLHEGVHSTGHKSLLNRITDEIFYHKEEYAKEELVAEMGAFMLMKYANVDNKHIKSNSQAYIKGWLKALESNPEWITSSLRQSVKAVRHILA